MRDVSVFRSPSLRSELSIRVHIDPFKSTRKGEAMAHSLGWLIAALILLGLQQLLAQTWLRRLP